MITIDWRRVAWALTMLAVLAMLIGLGTGCGPVEDGGKKTPKLTGGRIQNHPDSIQRINAYYSWGSQGPAGKPVSLKPGASTSSKKDADGFCTLDYPAEVTTITIFIGTVTAKSTVGAGKCVKVSDNQSVIVKVVDRLESTNA